MHSNHWITTHWDELIIYDESRDYFYFIVLLHIGVNLYMEEQRENILRS